MIISIIILIITFAVFLLLGLPISITIALSSFLVMIMHLPLDMSMLTSVQAMINSLNSFPLLAIPLFILSGSIMNTGGLAIRLINFSKLFTGKLPNPLWHINVIANMFFGALSGAAVAAEVAVGKIIIPLEEKDNYDMSFSTAVNITSCTTGLLIPPSNIFIVYSLVSGGTSISALFFAGYIPGILMGLGIMLVCILTSIKNKTKITREKITIKESLIIIWKAIPSLLLIVIVIGGIVKGVFTATEGAGIAALYSLILSLIYKSLTFKKLISIIEDTIIISGISLFLVACSSIMSWILSYSHIPEIVATALLSISSNPIIILLIINVILLIVGCFIDITPAILIFTPIFLPIVKSIGIHPVHFGTILAFNLCIGMMTPPVGNALFVGCSLTGKKIEDVIPKMIPIFAVLVIILLLVTFVPSISLFLPKIAGLLN
ncbi:TRAP transporter large permease [Brachyspira sp.]|uniref:TRAP transporter large permease n=1 Tax=Brachyspira sp. TaxID=1977261 RepID=UPI0026269543|nr:TRAP transporter large permease [Brachyspira sp.]